MDTLLHLLSPAYLFHRNLGPFTSDLASVFVWANVALIASALIVRTLAKKGDTFSRKSSAKFSSCAWTMGLIGIILYGFRQINVLYLSAPVFILVWVIVAVIWLGLVLNYHFRVVPKRREKVKKESQKREYL